MTNWGTSVGYTEHVNSIVVETTDGRIAVLSKQTFDEVYHRLDELNAAMKEDCIWYEECNNRIKLKNFKGDICYINPTLFHKQYDRGD